MNDSIEGVVFKDLATHIDDRGFFREIIRKTDDFFKEGFAQWSHSLMNKGVIKAWHFHKKQVDWWYLASGLALVALHDMRENSPTRGATLEFLLGDGQPPRVVKIPPMVAHGCRVLQGPSNLFYVTSQIYDPADEGRIPHDDPKIGYDWLKDPPRR